MRCGIKALQLALKCTPTAVVEPVNRALGAAHAVGDLARGKTHDVSQDDDLALVLGQRGQRGTNRQPPVHVRRACVVRIENFLTRRAATAAQVVDGDVARQPQ